jgi:hypothetical protein
MDWNIHKQNFIVPPPTTPKPENYPPSLPTLDGDLVPNARKSQTPENEDEQKRKGPKAPRFALMVVSM